jgi:hypothetical protein
MTIGHNGGPAFPMPGSNGPNDHYHYPEYGMTLRDYFAGQALAVCIQKCNPLEVLEGETMAGMFARRAYEAADAMIVERDRPRGV